LQLYFVQLRIAPQNPKTPNLISQIIKELIRKVKMRLKRERTIRSDRDTKSFARNTNKSFKPINEKLPQLEEDGTYSNDS